MVFEARHARGFAIVLAVALIPFVLAGLWITGQIVDMYDPHPKTGWAIAIASAAAIAIFARRAIGREPQLRIDGLGIHWRPLERAIPWEQLTGVHVVHVRNVPLLCLALKDPDHYPIANPALRALSHADRALGFGSVGINLVGLDKGFDEMVAAVGHFRPDLVHGRI